jgi:putative ABC transport system permease protein
MFDKDVWQEIFATIRKNKLRTFLTGFSVAWGIFMLIVLLGSGNGLQNAVKENFNSNSVNIMWLWTGETTIPYKGLKEGRPIKFKNDDYTFLTEKGKNLDLVSSVFWLPGNIVFTYNREYGSFQATSCYPAYKDIEKVKISSGRFINDIDMTDFRKVIVIGDNIRKTLFKNEDPIGKYLKLNRVPFEVIGVNHDPRNNDERTAYIPFTTAQRIFNGSDRVHEFSLTTKMVTTGEEAEAITQKVREDMAQRHKFDPKDERAMGSYNRMTDYIRTMKIFQAINIFIWIVGFGTLTAGIVGVSNIMLILVRERTREIGIRKALGATPSSVMELVLLESVLITTIAGYTGLVLGTGIMEAVNWALEQTTETGGNMFFRNPTVDFTTAVVSTVLLIIAGSLAGYLPALKAATVRPVEALRDE